MLKRLLVLTLVAYAAGGCSYNQWSTLTIGPRPPQPPNSYWCDTFSRASMPMDARGPGYGWCF